MGNKRLNKIFVKNMLSISALIIIFAVVSTTIFVISNISARKERMNLLETQAIKKAETTFDNMLLQISSLSSYFASSVFFIGSGTEENDYYLISTVQKQMDIAIATSDVIECIRIVDKTTGKELKSGATSDFLINGRPFVQAYGATFYENNDPSGPRIIYAQDNADQTYTRNNVYLGINASNFSKAVLLDSDDLRKEYFVNEEGEVFLARDANCVSKDIRDLYGISFSLSRQDIREVKIGKENKYLTVNPMGLEGLYIVSFADEDIYENLLVSTTWSVVLLVILLAISSIIVIVLIMRTTYRPIKDILNHVGSMALLENKSLSEVQYINQNFKKLQTHNDELYELVDEKMRELTNQHIAALQAQISPHFVYNTLDAVNWIAYRLLHDRENDISKAIKNMSLLFKSGMNISELFRSVSEEIEFVGIYLEILYIRMKDVFTVTWDVDADLYDCRILKLSIQPLVENVAEHAVDEDHSKVNIVISIKNVNHCIQVTVTDDGAGIPPDELLSIRDSINDFSNDTHHVGLKNLNERLQLLYGEESAIQIESVYQKGTTCSFLYPKIMKPEGENIFSKGDFT